MLGLEEQRLLDQVRALSSEAMEANEEVRWRVIAELQRIGGEPTFLRCQEWSTSSLAAERRLAADILAQLGYSDGNPFQSRIVPILTALMEDSEILVVESALTAFGHLHASECPDAVMELRKHPRPEVRYAVVHALLGQESADCVEALIELSRDSESKVRDWATFGLGTQIDLDTPEIREALFARTRDPDTDTRAEAITGLVSRGDNRAVAALVDALSSDVVGTLEIEAAKNTKAPELAPLLESLQSWWDVDVALLRDAILSCGGKPA